MTHSRSTTRLGRPSAARRGAAVLAALSGVVVLPATTTAAAGVDTDAYVLADVQCDPAGDGVLDLVLVNDHDTRTVEFVLDSVARKVAPRTADAVTFTQLSDGDVDIAISVDGVESIVHQTVHCDLPMVEVAPPPVPLRPGGTGGVSALTRPSAPTLPATGSDMTLWVVALAMTLGGAALSLAARRRGIPRD